jgi:hypothetical protein
MTPSSAVRGIAVGAGLVGAAAALLFGFGLLRSGTGVVFLTDAAPARWIQLDRPRKPMTYPIQTHGVTFRTRFETASKRDRAILEFRALHAAEIALDGEVVHRETPTDGDWRRLRSVDLAPLASGPHTLRIRVEASSAPAMLWAASEALSLSTGPSWEAFGVRRGWRPAAVASEGPQPFAIAREFTHAGRAFAKCLVTLLPVLLLAAIASLRSSAGRGRFIGDRITASRVRWTLLGAWGVLAINNIAAVPVWVGMDVELHMDYVRTLVAHHRIPLATEGGEMMQAPLAYLIMAPLYAWLSPLFAEPSVVKLLRVVPMACGLAQVELAYRAVRAVYPARGDLQILGTLLGGLLPVNLYLAQAVANEPVAGVTGGLVALLAIKLLMRPDAPDRKALVVLGAVFGLALLSKVTAVLLAPPVFAAVAFRARALRRALSGALLVFGTAALVGGWYYARNLLLMGSPFLGTWNAGVGSDWWQEPGFRMASQFLRFGEALAYPVFSAGVGLWDGLYSTLWLDGHLSGIAVRKMAPPWNFTFMLAGAWLALLPTAALGLGTARAFTRDHGAGAAGARAAQRFAVGCVACYLGAIVVLNIRVPFYCVAKSSYLVAATPCLAVIGAAGFDWLARNRIARASVFGGVACWAAAAYASYFAL